MKMRQEFMDLVRFAADYAKKSGADAAEAYITENQSVEVQVSNRQVEQVNAYQDAGIGLRILKERKMIFSSSNELSRDSIQDLIADLLKKVAYHTADECNVIPGAESGSLSGDWSGYTDLISFDPEFAERSVREKIQRALTIEKAGLDYSGKIKGAMMSVYQDSMIFVYMANSNGISGWYPSAGCGGYSSMIAAEGNDQQSGSHMMAALKYGDFQPAEVGRRAAEKAVKMLGAQPIKSCEIPLVVDPEMGVNFVSLVASMASAKLVQTGKSLLAGKLDTQIAAPFLDIIDDGRLKNGFGTSPVDGEGVPTQTTPIVVNGVLKNYLYDCYTAVKDKVKSTGNRSRGGYQSAGAVGGTNVYMKKGSIKPQAIISGIKRGFYMNVAFGLHAGVDPTSGDFSFPVAGFMIENGRIAAPVRGISIAGNIFDFMKSIDKIGSDLTWFQTQGCPTFSVPNIKIGGVS